MVAVGGGLGEATGGNMSHRPHPSGFDPEDAILFDNCERCFDHAQNGGADLDPQTFAKAWNRMLAVERGDQSYRTEAEADLCRSLYRMAVMIDRHGICSVSVWLRLDAEDE